MMRGVLGLKWRALRDGWYSFGFRKHCTRVGPGMIVQGPCDFSCDGVLSVGRNFRARSKRYNRVEFFVSRNAQLFIGDDVFLNQGVRIACTSNVRIGDGCMIGDEAILLDSDYHSVGQAPVREEGVFLEDRVWLASRVIVLRGVTIGHDSIIGAGSVVTRSIPPHSLAVGIPARVIRKILPNK